MRACLLFLCGLLWSATVATAQTSPASATTTASAMAPKRQLTALRITQPIKIDGALDEAAWQEAPVATKFIQEKPNPGLPEKLPTEVRVLYDDAALYIGAVLHDVSPDSIMQELSQRDNLENTDFFGVFIDTYHDRLNGYGFLITPGGVQLDSRYSPAGGEDFGWNAVWESRTSLRGTDWIAEIRIPYSAIRFSKAPEQLWGLNFMRQRKRDNQRFFWNEVRPAVDGFVNQWGDLTGVRDIKPPLRLSLTPYVSAYVNHYPYHQQGVRNTDMSFNGGADIKYGINESFTLDATLVPDFGQTQSDNVVLNLSPFEVQYNENRTFFTEGTELFNKGGLFYSRRVGAQPMGFYDAEGQLRKGERVVSNPGVSRLINATKVSGRTSKGLGIGVFNAVSKEMFATVRDSLSGDERQVMTQPLSNYNIVVLDQSLKNNSYVSLINTNVTRAGQVYDANVTGGLFRIANKKNSYAVDGQVVYSRRRGQAFASEAPIDNKNGYKYLVGVAKIAGNFTWRLSQSITSNTYDPNDLGLLFSNNAITQVADFSYNKYKPFWKVNNMYTYWGVSQSLLYKPTRYQDLSVYGGGNTTFTKSFITVGFNVDASPATHDFYEPRVEPLGRYFVRKPANVGANAFISSDYRKKIAYDVSAAIRGYAHDGSRHGRDGYGLSFSPRYRVSNQLTFRYNFDWQMQRNQIGFAGGLNGDEPLDRVFYDRGDIMLGRRRVVTVTNTLSGSYTFNNRMSLTIRTRHYVSTVHYRDFTRLLDDGKEESIDYRRNRDTSFNAFNVDAVYAWWFAPGSQVSIVWKNAGSSSLIADEATPQYFRNLNNTVNTPHNNSLSIKVLYYIDYLMLKPKRG
ncbi:DUF5916 domain-containing protein [Hymenobacter jejuensis]|uniref:Carbohydrate binding family 9 domain-containing protein n=1 Tax=Hymenobacter jejuensis TaxID=2502781 RepID=A0A5B8A4C6_9BACT|nr:DUF5916 domain-containing protein [Hymenobacter jejuensis]QDA60992.1 carbohydrate binding family 9 domain-containing protein [Hymenobacter jejuensis]